MNIPTNVPTNDKDAHAQPYPQLHTHADVHNAQLHTHRIGALFVGLLIDLYIYIYIIIQKNKYKKIKKIYISKNMLTMHQ